MRTLINILIFSPKNEARGRLHLEMEHVGKKIGSYDPIGVYTKENMITIYDLIDFV